MLTDNTVAAATSKTKLRPSAAAKAIGAALILAVLLLRDTGVTYGFLIPLVMLTLLDAALSTRALRNRHVSVRPRTTAVATPDLHRFGVQATPGWARLVVTIAPLSPLDHPSSEVLVRDDGSETEVVLGDGHAIAKSYVRYEVRASTFGLVWASEWNVQALSSMLYRAPAGRLRDSAQLTVFDEVARLREYVPGDRMSRVSWPVTARTGHLHVRAEGPSGGEIVVVLDLGTHDALTVDNLNSTLLLAHVVLVRLLDSGHTVRLISRRMSPDFFHSDFAHAMTAPGAATFPPIIADEDGYLLLGGVRMNDTIDDQHVYDRGDLIRRLAVADIGPPTPPPSGPYLEVNLEGVRSYG